MKKVLSIGLIALAVFGLTGCTEELKDLNDSIDDLNESLNSSDYLVLDENNVTTQSSSYSYYINGYISNTSNTYSFDYVQVTFTTYDNEGNTIGTCLANNSGLEAGGRWKFSAICLDEPSEIATYKLTDITGY